MLVRSRLILQYGNDYLSIKKAILSVWVWDWYFVVKRNTRIFCRYKVKSSFFISIHFSFLIDKTKIKAYLSSPLFELDIAFSYNILDLDIVNMHALEKENNFTKSCLSKRQLNTKILETCFYKRYGIMFVKLSKEYISTKCGFGDRTIQFKLCYRQHHHHQHHHNYWKSYQISYAHYDVYWFEFLIFSLRSD